MEIVKEEKQAVRKQIMDTLSNVTKPRYEQLSAEIAQQLYQDSLWKKAKIIGITISRFPEVDTYEIIRKAWEEGKQVAVPKCLPQSREMVFRIITEFHQLETVYSNLLEPIVELAKEVQGNEMDLLIVPGLAFTKEGYRLGFGGGYYDRFLTKFKGETIALAFESQIVAELPLDSHDLPIRKIFIAKGH